MAWNDDITEAFAAAISAAKKYTDEETEQMRTKFVKVNVDNAPELAQKYLVMSIPTLKMVKNGEEIGSFVGAMSAEELEDWVKEVCMM